jgi:hypothetical protein
LMVPSYHCLVPVIYSYFVFVYHKIKIIEIMIEMKCL